MFNQHVPTLPQAFKKTTLKSCRAEEVLAEQPVPVGPGLLLSVKPVIAQTPAAVLVPRVCQVFRVNLELDGHGTAFGEGANRKSLSEMDIICSVRWGINNCFIHKLGRKIPDLWVFTKSHSSYLLKIKSLNSLLSICTVPIGEGLYQGSNFCQMGAKCPLTDCSLSGTGILSGDLKYLEADGFLFQYMFGMYFCLQEEARMGKGEVSCSSLCCV